MLKTLRPNSRVYWNKASLYQKLTSVNRRSNSTSESVKSFAEIPGPKCYPIIGTMADFLKKDGLKFNKYFEAMQKRSKIYGPIYKETLGGQTSVIISDPAHYSVIMRHEGRCPHRIALDPMVTYRKMRKMSLGVINLQGVEWYRNRAVLQPKLLKPQETHAHLPDMNEVADNFMVRLKGITHKNDGLVNDFPMEIFKWTMESIGTVLLEKRIGCFNQPPSAQATEFIRSLGGYFSTLQPLLFKAPLYKIFPSKLWKVHTAYADKIVEIALDYVVEKEKMLAKGVEKPGFLGYLLKQKALTPQEVNIHVIDLMTAAIETTSNAFLWTLYNLATNPETQDTLRDEINRVYAGRNEVQLEDLNQLQYLKSCLKETFRLYPITFATSRILPEDIVCSGFLIPKGVHIQANLYGMGRDSKLFADPLSYQPDRWCRQTDSRSAEVSDSERAHLESCDEVYRLQQLVVNLVFGHGSRMCLGRRLAEQELYILFSKLIKNFKVTYIGDEAPQPTLNTVLTPDRKLQFHFEPITLKT